jgi:hypothetical protein
MCNKLQQRVSIDDVFKASACDSSISTVCRIVSAVGLFEYPFIERELICALDGNFLKIRVIGINEKIVITF